MESTPDILGCKLEDALALLDKNNLNAITKESVGHKCEKQGDIRVIRQKKLNHNEVELIISYF